jgi:hypothetical protein
MTTDDDLTEEQQPTAPARGPVSPGLGPHRGQTWPYEGLWLEIRRALAQLRDGEELSLTGALDPTDAALGEMAMAAASVLWGWLNGHMEGRRDGDHR